MLYIAWYGTEIYEENMIFFDNVNIIVNYEINITIRWISIQGWYGILVLRNAQYLLTIEQV